MTVLDVLFCGENDSEGIFLDGLCEGIGLAADELIFEGVEKFGV